ncbi:hypothetical protein [Paludisphaera rhizosphaerae]|uniref:hypothetical protein n=1 Tax=Paludisphaera rhizosphaerae TaxID=2711216 RepID=UPI0013EBA549|nr:hypothetical protein [Paludisphaera rhizosphaerae]
MARIATADVAAASRIARNISDPWFRCQALASVAWRVDAEKPFFGIIDESLESGWSIKIPNRAATVVAWPVAALAGHSLSGPGARERTRSMFRAALDQVRKVVAEDLSPISRADALLIHVHALSPSCPELRKGIIDLLMKECRDPANRKRQRQIEEAALVIARDDPGTALTLASSLDESRRRRTVASIEQKNVVLGPRSFFEGTRPR